MAEFDPARYTLPQLDLFLQTNTDEMARLTTAKRTLDNQAHNIQQRINLLKIRHVSAKRARETLIKAERERVRITGKRTAPAPAPVTSSSSQVKRRPLVSSFDDSVITMRDVAPATPDAIAAATAAANALMDLNSQTTGDDSCSSDYSADDEEQTPSSTDDTSSSSEEEEEEEVTSPSE